MTAVELYAVQAMELAARGGAAIDGSAERRLTEPSWAEVALPTAQQTLPRSVGGGGGARCRWGS